MLVCEFSGSNRELIASACVDSDRQRSLLRGNFVAVVAGLGEPIGYQQGEDHGSLGKF
jgi:hypothetical protein